MVLLTDGLDQAYLFFQLKKNLLFLARNELGSDFSARYWCPSVESFQRLF